MASWRLATAVAGLTGACLLSGCTSSSTTRTAPTPASAVGVTITVTANACGDSWRRPPTGLQTFQVRNASPSPVDVSLTDPDTGGVYADIEALAPGTTRPLQVNVGSGSYAFQCDSGHGDPLTGPTVVVPGRVAGGQAVTPPDVTASLAAVTDDRRYITTGLATVARQVSTLVADITAGNLSDARGAWLTAHLSWEQLGSAYGMFGDWDDAIDGIPNGLPGGANDPSFTGFYRLEYGLWHGQSASDLTGPAQQLRTDIQHLQAAYPGMATIPGKALSDLALRTHEILEHAIRFQLSGGDDFGSGTTLATASANIGATRAQLDMMRPLLAKQYAGLPAAYAWLDRLHRLVDAGHSSNGWHPVTALTPAQRASINSAAAQTVQLLAPIAAMYEVSPL
jgi:iron uptake system component EfeO